MLCLAILLLSFLFLFGFPFQLSLFNRFLHVRSVRHYSLNCLLCIEMLRFYCGELQDVFADFHWAEYSFDLLVFFLPFGSLQEWLPAKNLLYEAFSESFDLLLHLLKFCLAVEVFDDSDLRGDGKESM